MELEIFEAFRAAGVPDVERTDPLVRWFDFRVGRDVRGDHAAAGGLTRARDRAHRRENRRLPQVSCSVTKWI